MQALRTWNAGVASWAVKELTAEAQAARSAEAAAQSSNVRLPSSDRIGGQCQGHSHDPDEALVTGEGRSRRRLVQKHCHGPTTQACRRNRSTHGGRQQGWIDPGHGTAMKGHAMSAAESRHMLPPSPSFSWVNSGGKPCPAVGSCIW